MASAKEQVDSFIVSNLMQRRTALTNEAQTLKRAEKRLAAIAEELTHINAKLKEHGHVDPEDE